MSSSEPPKPPRRSMVNPSQPGVASPSVVGKSATAPAPGTASPPGEAAQASVVNTQMTGDPKIGTQPQSMTGPGPQFKTLGRYTVIGELGRGGMGAVFLAEDTILKRKVALKIPQFEPRKEEQMRARFIREAQLAAQLTHPNICQIYDVGEIDGQLVMAMEYIEGRDLSTFTKPDKLMSARVVVGLVKKIALAVETAHRLGMVHRDLKPSNIMLAQTDKSKKTVEPKVMDFGLAKSLEPTEKQLTHSGMIVGTPCYMSKEQWSGKDGNLGPSSDVFSLGTILYELLTGHLPFDADEGEPATAWFVKLVTREQILPSERKPGIDPGLEAIVMRSIAKDVENRYATMAEFATALDGWIKGKPTPAGPVIQSLAELQFDEEMLALIEQTPKRAKKSKRQRPSSIPKWLIWAGGGAAAALLLGIVLIFRNSKGETTRVETDGPTATLTTPEGTVTASTSPTASGGRESAESPLPPPTITPSESLIGTKAGDLREITLPGNVTLKQVWCPPGAFTMGTPGATDIEAPVQVTLTQGFWLGQTEVTQSQWTAVMGVASKPWSGQEYVQEGPNFPASWISHGVNPDGAIEADSATAFCEKLTEIERQAGRLPTGWKYTLPTEAQWEYACRAGTQTAYSFGDDESQLGEYAWWGGRVGNGNARTEQYAHEVGTKKPNPWGLSDMHGNLYEWCRDGYADKLLEGSDPVNTSAVDRRVLRGSAWSNKATFTRSAFRSRNRPDFRVGDYGFRVVMTQENELEAGPVASPTGPVSVVPPQAKMEGQPQPSPSTPTVPDPQSVSLIGTKAGDLREITLPGGVKLKQVWCPPGTFTMGTPGATNREAPVSVTLTKGFWFGQTEVTQSQWTAVLGAASKPWSGLPYVKEGPDFPASYISHGENSDGTIDAYSATAFCEKLTEIERQSGRLPTGWKYALPTESQWEYACRAGTTTEYSFGDDESKLGDYTWWGGHQGNGNATSEQYAHAVGMKKPNPWGLSDMHGNLWEWCADRYGDHRAGGPNPAGPATGSTRVIRGGCWSYLAEDCRSAFCRMHDPSYRNCSLGFRICLRSDVMPTPDPQIPVNDSPAVSLIGTKAGDLREITLPGNVTLKQVWCPPGTFMMGTPLVTNDEASMQVTLTQGFWLATTEVTQSQWTTVMGAASKPWSRQTGGREGPNFPASDISHGVNADGTIDADSATAFCEKLTESELQAGRLPSRWKYSLPTEAQWEYACRAGTKTKYSFGDNESQLSKYAWWGGIDGNGNAKTERYAHAVGTKQPNPWGLFDMHGNLFEWCSDGYAGKLQGGKNPAGLSTSSYRMKRGGSWSGTAARCRSADREADAPSYRVYNLGFRVCLSSD